MKTLVIFAHPGKEGHNTTILNGVERELNNRKIEYEVVDLYKLGFNPTLRKEELSKISKDDADPVVVALQEKVTAAEHLIFIYPVWWNGPPAILKGFFDRVFIAGFAFKYVDILHWFKAPKGLLKGKKASIFITTGSPTILALLVQGFRGGRIVKCDILRFCGIRSKIFQFGPAYKFSSHSKPKLERLVKKGLNWLY